MSETFQASIPLPEAVLLLNKGGWIPENAVVDPGTLTSVVSDFQQFWGLYDDGILGPATLAKLQEPRFCAHPDKQSMELQLGSGGGIPRWGKKNLTIEVVGDLGPISNSVFADGVITGARTWSKFCGIKFDIVRSNGDIVIDGAHIDGPGRVLAYMQLPSSDGFMGRLKGRWGSNENWPQIIVAVSAHEIGHALGLVHTGVPNQLMNPTLSRFTEPQAAWDIPQGVTRYGHPATQPPPPPPPDGEWWELGWTPKDSDFQFNIRSRSGAIVVEELLRAREELTQGMT